MGRLGRCPYTKSGEWPDTGLVRIIEKSLSRPEPECPECGGDVVVRGSGEVAWAECSECGMKVGSTVIT